MKTKNIALTLKLNHHLDRRRSVYNQQFLTPQLFIKDRHVCECESLNAYSLLLLGFLLAIISFLNNIKKKYFVYNH